MRPSAGSRATSSRPRATPCSRRGTARRRSGSPPPTPGEIQLLLSDVVLPGIDGGLVYETLRKARPALKHLFISGYAEEVLAWRGVVGPDFRLLQKPFTIQALAQKVREALDACLVDLQDPLAQGSGTARACGDSRPDAKIRGL